MQRAQIEKIVDSAFDRALEEIRPSMRRELHPAAFANEYSWLRVNNALDLQNAAIRCALKAVLAELFAE